MNNKSSEITEFIAKIQLWRGLPEDQLDAIAQIAIAKTYPKGEIIFNEGDEGIGFFAVKSGRVKVFKLSTDGKEQILHFFTAGDHFAEVPAFDGQCFPASAAALEKTELLFFPRTSFLVLLQQHPNLSINIIAIFARHLRRFAQIIEDLSFKEVPGRLAAYLLYLSERNGTLEEVELDMAKSQLAAFLATIPETLSRVFAKLSQEGLIAIDGAKIEILDRQRLTELAAGKK
ncbi:MAG TPA: Crp/Fnr family transcriptional regulator [Cyanobacteria bacterium UBA11149]|nr:Crp/Fnr family transcriptional regulator [Cyanobacteria bacterium UBA11367]HBE61048.1 Crp/Fnr family transcriptional regulator [Cyanobacteria bacterium UBA11366]HBK62288.1 Crp/Fnr family transcriptional regulator [Cyanobacteria bacterium UBA11166]HBR74234.1 Crp/Fnr family transcriptional regulator [Cyanobacteria bacterium UBA11159]HBS69869.1 Crp/Fnr family transcriptional regulator [Cyanobacteria bacterium UBA11153]HBW91033.1 Crp/Fnr family transcriptional regulator [Cyanobacteria bacterium